MYLEQQTFPVKGKEYYVPFIILYSDDAIPVHFQLIFGAFTFQSRWCSAHTQFTVIKKPVQNARSARQEDRRRAIKEREKREQQSRRGDLSVC